MNWNCLSVLTNILTELLVPFYFKNLTKAEKIQPESADWPSMFSTVQSFNPAVVPLPVRMGRVRPNKLGDIPPAAQGNIEVLKVVTCIFLHAA